MITKFNLKGFYEWVNAPNGKGDLTGEIEVAEDGYFEGGIHDHASIAPNQFIKGYLQLNEINKLLFLKFPPKQDLVNIVYELTKKGNSIEGKYIGEWGALPHKIKFIKKLNLFIAQIDMSLCGIGDRAEINLYKVA